MIRIKTIIYISISRNIFRYILQMLTISKRRKKKVGSRQTQSGFPDTRGTRRMGRLSGGSGYFTAILMPESPKRAMTTSPAFTAIEAVPLMAFTRPTILPSPV